jgi:ABC-type phosphate transport system substrate-binding protein
MKKNLLATIVAAASVAALVPAHAELVIIVSSKNPATSLTREQVAQIFLGKNTSFPGGGTAMPLDLTEGAALRDEFYAKVGEKSAGQVKAYWAKQMFSGKGTPPREIQGAAEMKKAVAADATAIGYVDRATLDSTVKAVLTVP